MTIHSLGRASSGALHHAGVLVGTADKGLTLFDVYHNELLRIELPSPAKSLAASLNQDDMYVGILTEDNQVCVSNISVHKNFKVNKETLQLEAIESSELGTSRVRQNGKVKGFEYVDEDFYARTGTEDLYAKKYKAMLKLWVFNHTLECRQVEELESRSKGSQIVSYVTKGEQFFLLKIRHAQSLNDEILVLTRFLTPFKTVRTHDHIVDFNKQHTSIFIAHNRSITFFKS